MINQEETLKKLQDTERIFHKDLLEILKKTEQAQIKQENIAKKNKELAMKQREYAEIGNANDELIKKLDDTSISEKEFNEIVNKITSYNKTREDLSKKMYEILK